MVCELVGMMSPARITLYTAWADFSTVAELAFLVAAFFMSIIRDTFFSPRFVYIPQGLRLHLNSSTIFSYLNQLEDLNLLYCTAAFSLLKCIGQVKMWLFRYYFKNSERIKDVDFDMIVQILSVKQLHLCESNHS